MNARGYKQKGFTIVELLIVIVVIAILAAITIVAYNGIQQRSQVAAIKSGAVQISKKLEVHKLSNGAYPATLADIQVSDTSTTTYSYTTVHSASAACIAAQTGNITYSVQNGSEPVLGGCGQVIAQYYTNPTFSGSPFITRSESAISNAWGAGGPDATMATDNFSAVWRSSVIPPVTGSYLFYTNTDDHFKLVVGGVAVIPWTTSGARDATSTVVDLIAGQPVSVEYSMAEYGGSAYATLFWSYPGQAKIVIPAASFLRL